jgi:hypothetical protein
MDVIAEGGAPVCQVQVQLQLTPWCLLPVGAAEYAFIRSQQPGPPPTTTPRVVHCLTRVATATTALQERIHGGGFCATVH